MTIPAVAKIGGTAAVVAGVPTTVYLTSDHIFFYEIEREVISGSDDLVSAAVTNEATVEGKTNIVKISSGNKWSCLIRAESTAQLDSSSDVPKLKKHLEARIPATSSGSSATTSLSSEEKQKNRKQLVWGCSWNRDPVNGNSISSSLTINVKKTGTNLKVTLFGEEKEVTET